MPVISARSRSHHSGLSEPHLLSSQHTARSQSRSHPSSVICIPSDSSDHHINDISALREQIIALREQNHSLKDSSDRLATELNKLKYDLLFISYIQINDSVVRNSQLEILDVIKETREDVKTLINRVTGTGVVGPIPVIPGELKFEDYPNCKFWYESTWQDLSNK